MDAENPWTLTAGKSRKKRDCSQTSQKTPAQRATALDTDGAQDPRLRCTAFARDSGHTRPGSCIKPAKTGPENDAVKDTALLKRDRGVKPQTSGKLSLGRDRTGPSPLLPQPASNAAETKFLRRTLRNSSKSVSESPFTTMGELSVPPPFLSRRPMARPPKADSAVKQPRIPRSAGRCPDPGGPGSLRNL